MWKQILRNFQLKLILNEIKIFKKTLHLSRMIGTISVRISQNAFVSREKERERDILRSKMEMSKRVGNFFQSFCAFKSIGCIFCRDSYACVNISTKWTDRYSEVACKLTSLFIFGWLMECDWHDVFIQYGYLKREKWNILIRRAKSDKEAPHKTKNTKCAKLF